MKEVHRGFLFLIFFFNTLPPSADSVFNPKNVFGGNYVQKNGFPNTAAQVPQFKAVYHTFPSRLKYNQQSVRPQTDERNGRRHWFKPVRFPMSTHCTYPVANYNTKRLFFQGKGRSGNLIRLISLKFLTADKIQLFNFNPFYSKLAI